MMTLRYWGEYLSDSGVLWRCELHQRGDFVPVELEGFPAEPLTIEWRADGGKMATLHTSAATLNVISKTDRQFLDLYQVEVGVVMLKVFRNGVLYWSGSLDPELYEEPYAYKDGYDVMLTFSDFAPLDRIKWSHTGFVTFDEIVKIALDAAFVEYSEIQRMISTSLELGAAPLTLSELVVMCANFYDEDGEPMTVREVLEETLKPLALHLVQRNGRILIFDTNALHALPSTPVAWASTDANLSTDETYNNVTVNFSPYGDSEILKIEMDEKTTATDATDGTLIHVNYDDTDRVLPPEGFRVYVGDKSDTDIRLLNSARFCRLESEFSGSNECAIARTIRTMITLRPKPHTPYYNVGGLVESTPVFDWIGYPISIPIIECPAKSIYVPTTFADDFRLKISLDTLFDVRYNPFEQAEEYNEEGDWGELQNCSVAYVPIMLNLLDDNNNVVYHFNNDTDRTQSGYKNTGRWIEGVGNLGCAWLCYYDNNNRYENSGLGGWAKNKACIGGGLFALPSKITMMGDGMFIPMPPASGRIQMIVGSGVHCVRFTLFGDVAEVDIHPYVRWVMYRNPAIEIVKRNSRGYEVQEVEHRAWINRNAQEELAIDTVIGTLSEPSPSARGQILDTSHIPIQKLARAGIYDSVERLLIGTAYSAYAGRSNVLSGTVESLVDYMPMSDRAISGKYMIVSEVERTWEDMSEITMVEFTADNYEGVDYDD